MGIGAPEFDSQKIDPEVYVLFGAYSERVGMSLDNFFKLLVEFDLDLVRGTSLFQQEQEDQHVDAECFARILSELGWIPTRYRPERYTRYQERSL